MTITSRDKEIAELLEEFNKKKGAGALRVGDMTIECDVISTGSLPLDLALGVGGIPRGRITEIYGPEGSGKTTLALTVAANAQKAGGRVAYIDAEHAVDPKYAEAIGVNIDSLIISQPDCGEDALEAAELLCKSKLIDVVVVDSVASLIPKAELEGNIGDHHVGAQARMMSQALRKIVGIVHKSNTALIFINQLREKIGVMFGNPETTPGGRALRFYSSVRIDIRRIKTNKSGGESLSNQVKCKVVKNRVGPPYRQAIFDIVFGKGISQEACVLDMADEHQIVSKRGSNYYFNDEKIAISRQKAIEALEENPNLMDAIHREVLIKAGIVEDSSVENTVDGESTEI